MSRANGVKLLTLLAGAVLVAGTAGCSGEVSLSAEEESQWRQLPDPPLNPRDEAVLVGMEEQVLVVGGWEFSCPPNADCAMPAGPLFADGALYDARSDSWSEVAAAPLGMRGYGAVSTSLDGVAYVVTACSDGPECGAPARLLSYQLDEDRWSDHGVVPGFTYGAASITPASGKLVVSGNAVAGFIDAVFDVASETWTQLPDDPLGPVYDRFVVLESDQLVVAGSPITVPGGEEQPSKVAARFDLTTGEWVSLPDAPGSGYELFTTDKGPLLVGEERGAPSWLLNPATWTWEEVEETTSKDDDVDGVVDRTRAVYTIEGGLGGPVYSSTVVFDSGSGKFLTLGPPPGREEVWGDSSVALGRDLFTYGGQRWTQNRSGEPVGDAWLWRAPAS